MTKSEGYYNELPMALTLADVKKHVECHKFRLQIYALAGCPTLQYHSR